MVHLHVETYRTASRECRQSETDMRSCQLSYPTIQKARGDGWCTYDQLCHQHAAAKPDRPWATQDGSIHAATIGTHCRLCTESDQLAQECALASILNQNQLDRFAQHNQAAYRRPLPAPANMTRPICNSWNRGKCAMCLCAAIGTSVPHARRVNNKLRTVRTPRWTASSIDLLHPHVMATGRKGPHII